MAALPVEARHDRRVVRSPIPFLDLDRYGEHPAVLAGDELLSYSDLADRVEIAARSLPITRSLVLVAVRRDLDALVTYLAALTVGHVVLLADGEHREHVDNLAAAFDPDVVARPLGGSWETMVRREETVHDLHPDLALLLSTSGTTGSSKLVRLSHENLSANAESIAASLRLDADHRAMTTLPIHYCYGLSIVHSHLACGGSIVLSDLSVVDRCFWDLFRATGATSIAGVPHTFDLLDRVGFDGFDLPSLRLVTQAGGRLPPDRVRHYAGLGQKSLWDFVVMYGQTEATARMAYLPPDHAHDRPSTIGLPIPGGRFDIESADADGVGELVYTGPNVMMGYARTPGDLARGRDLTRLRTGDLARRGDDGLYEIVGRLSRFVKPFGLRIDLDQVECTLGQNGIDAYVNGDDHSVAVGVTAACPLPDAEVRDAVARQCGLPCGRIHITRFAHLPVLANGKPDRSHLAPPELDAEVDLPPVGAVDTDRALVAAYAAVLGRADLDPTRSFVELGGDSLSYVELSIRIEAVLGHLPADWHAHPIADLAAEGARSRRTRRRLTATMDTTVVLRAVAIVFVVSTHAGLTNVRGGAHLLLAVAGYNLGRFALSRPERTDRLRAVLRSTARVVVPTLAWIVFGMLVLGRYQLVNLTLLNNVVGSDRWSERWHFWYIEVLVQVVVGLALLLAIPAVHRLERRVPFLLPLALASGGLLVRYDVLGLGGDPVRLGVTERIGWFVPLGWAAARADTTPKRVAVSALTATTVLGFFEQDTRGWAVFAGVLLVVWLPRIAVPRVLHRAVGVVAAASLYIYITHWHVYREVLQAGYGPGAAVTAAVLAGTALWWGVERTSAVVRRS